MDRELVVALFDVLGFEDRVGRYSLGEVHDQYRDLLAIAKTKGSHVFLDARPVGDGTSVPYMGYIEIDQDYFSDTILLWTPFKPPALKTFLHVCCSFICETLLAGLPVRGALALGSAIMDKSSRTYIGKPLVEAARVEKAQRWIGLSFGRSFDSRRDVPFSADLVRPYTDHRKPGYGDLVLGAAVDWPRAWRQEHKASAVTAVERLERRADVEEYYRCTLEFVRQSDSNPDWWKTYQVAAHTGVRLPLTGFRAI